MILKEGTTLQSSIYSQSIFFKSVHTLLLRPSPYPCTQRYAFGGTPHPPPKAYVLYGWPQRRLKFQKFDNQKGGGGPKFWKLQKGGNLLCGGNQKGRGDFLKSKFHDLTGAWGEGVGRGYQNEEILKLVPSKLLNSQSKVSNWCNLLIYRINIQNWLNNMLKIYLVFGESEPQYFYKRHAYKNM